MAEGGQLGAGARELRLTVPALAPGRYEVRWASWSAEDNEGHRGTYAFTVVEASPTPVRTARSTPSAEPPASDPSTAVSSGTASVNTSSPSATTAQSPVPEPASDAGSVAVPILVSVLALVGLGGWLLRRRGA